MPVGPCGERGFHRRWALDLSASSAAMVMACYAMASVCCTVPSDGVFVSAVLSPASERISGSNVVV